MADTNLAAMDAIMRIRDAQCAAARAEVMAAENDLDRMRDAERQGLADRETAERGWLAVLQTRWPDPALVRLSGNWLIECEKRLNAVRIDTRIAQSGLDTAIEGHQHSRAKLDASSQIARRLHKDVARKRDARSLVEAADAYLRRRA